MTAGLDYATVGTVAGRDEAGSELIGPLARVSGCDLQVPLVQGGECTYANFDYAASAPALAAVTDCVTELLPYYASVHRGAGYPSQVSTACYERARESVARFCGAAADQVVVFTRNTTDALNLLAACVPGDVVVLDVEHHANLLAWRRGRRVVEAADTLDETVCRIIAELCSKPAALLAITGASNVTGEVLPLARLAEVAHACGARILVDAAQLAPHRRIDVAACGIDYLAFSGHKLYAPFGAGVLLGRADWLDAAPPYLAGGGAVREVTTTGVEWAPAPQRHEAGTPNVVGVAALAAACDALSGLDAATVRAHEEALCARLRAGLAAVPGVEVLRLWRDSTDDSPSLRSPWDSVDSPSLRSPWGSVDSPSLRSPWGSVDSPSLRSPWDSVGIVAFTVDGYEADVVAAYLSAEHGIGVRDGRFCAHPLLARLGLDAAVRASIGLGTSGADVERLIAAVTSLVEFGPSWDYDRSTGRAAPNPETRSFPIT